MRSTEGELLGLILQSTDKARVVAMSGDGPETRRRTDVSCLRCGVLACICRAVSQASAGVVGENDRLCTCPFLSMFASSSPGPQRGPQREITQLAVWKDLKSR